MSAKECRSAWASHIGGRPVQQDNAACFASHDGRSHLLVLADGMGGHQGGEIASEAVVATAVNLWQLQGGSVHDPHTFLETLCQQAHEEILQRGRQLGLRPLSTIAAVFATPARAWWVHVGDSRVYGFCDGKPVSRTEDHTLVHNLVRTGALLETERDNHPDQHKLLRGLGGDVALRTSHGQMRMTPATGFVLCSDGFWTAVDVEEMSGLINTDNAQAACVHWAARAAERGGSSGDNVTVGVMLPSRSAPARSFERYWPIYAACAVALAIVLARALS